ncbi:MAG TPA: hypothetical protein VN040_16040 [Pseudosphingobacterium sp.]|nr:hypothetical protein [Pseudosphingobacterium sp.]
MALIAVPGVPCCRSARAFATFGSPAPYGFCRPVGVCYRGSVLLASAAFPCGGTTDMFKVLPGPYLINRILIRGRRFTAAAHRRAVSTTRTLNTRVVKKSTERFIGL